MLSVVYVSSAARLFSEVELRELLAQCRDNNTRLNVTGMLLYKDGNFMQVLEGDEADVRMLMARIADDPRHKGVLKLIEDRVEERQFAEWSMGFRNLSAEELRDVPGYSPFLNEPLTSNSFRSDPSRAQKLLMVFRKNNA